MVFAGSPLRLANSWLTWVFLSRLGNEVEMLKYHEEKYCMYILAAFRRFKQGIVKRMLLYPPRERFVKNPLLNFSAWTRQWCDVWLYDRIDLCQTVLCNNTVIRNK